MNNCPLPLLGGITEDKVKKITEGTSAHRKARKNLFLLELSSPIFSDVAANRFNMYCTGIDSTLFSIAGAPQQVGAVSADIVNQRDANELTITTMDDLEGTIKRWFGLHADAAAGIDGTVGLPASYAIKIKLTHAYIERTKQNHFWQKWLYRAGNLSVNLNRQEDGLEEISMTFPQIDMFMPA